MKSQYPTSSDATDLEAYFTDVEYLRGLFTDLVASRQLDKRLLVIHGLGGIGKTSLIRMFCLHCISKRVPYGLASAEDSKSPAEVLSNWANDLTKTSKVILPNFAKTLNHFLAIQAKVEEHARNAQNTRGKVAQNVGKAAARTAIEIAAGYIPFVGPIVSALAGASLDALADWLSGFLSKKDIDFLLDPTARLTEEFLADIARIAAKQRAILVLDTYEQIINLSDWMRHVTQNLHPNVILVIAGRVIPNWNRQWPTWMVQAEVHELKPMTDDIMKELINQYYRLMRNSEPDPIQVDAIIRFARGLPIVVTSCVQMWVQYGVADFQSIKLQVGADLVDRLIEGVPQSLKSGLEAAAALRWFNRDLLASLLNEEDVSGIYEELRRFPFVNVRAEGLALHDVIREIIDENLEFHAPDRHHYLHERASNYFASNTTVIAKLDAEKVRREWLYHRIRAEEKSGVEDFQKWAEELTRANFVGRLQTLVNEVSTFPLHGANSQEWRNYYSARLMHTKGSFSEAEVIYIQISENETTDPKLRAYALCDLCQLWSRTRRLSELGGNQRLLQAIEHIRQLVPQFDSKLVLVFLYARYAYMSLGELDKAVGSLKQLYDSCLQAGDQYGTIYALDKLKDLYGLLGDWRGADNSEKEGVERLKLLPQNQFLHTRIVGHNIWHKVWSGKYSDAENGMRQALALAESENQLESLPGLFRDLGLISGLQRRWSQSHEYFKKSAARYKEWGKWNGGLGGTLGFWGTTFARQKIFRKAKPLLMQSLEIKRRGKDNNGIPEVLVWLGELHEMIGKETIDRTHLAQAESYYLQSLEYRWTCRKYFECAALTGLMRVHYENRNYDEASYSFVLAKEMGNEYRYHDLLASLYLYHGHMRWKEANAIQVNTIASSYLASLVHALCFNRFLVDDILVESDIASPLVSVIAYCKLQGDEGQRLLNYLKEWWQKDISELPADISISDLPRHSKIKSLIQSEELARTKELGDGSPQRMLIEVLNQFTSP